jgi:hypothetical protein
MAQTPCDALAGYDAMREAALAEARERLHARASAPPGIPVRLSMIDEMTL